MVASRDTKVTGVTTKAATENPIEKETLAGVSSLGGRLANTGKLVRTASVIPNL